MAGFCAIAGLRPLRRLKHAKRARSNRSRLGASALPVLYDLCSRNRNLLCSCWVPVQPQQTGDVSAVTYPVTAADRLLAARRHRLATRQRRSPGSTAAGHGTDEVRTRGARARGAEREMTRPEHCASPAAAISATPPFRRQTLRDAARAPLLCCCWYLHSVPLSSPLLLPTCNAGLAPGTALRKSATTFVDHEAHALALGVVVVADQADVVIRVRAAACSSSSTTRFRFCSPKNGSFHMVQ